MASCEQCGYKPPDPRIGVLLEGKFRIDALLGEGGMGRVYRATHMQLGEPVAVKFLLAEYAKQPEVRARFRREAVALARLRHPGIVSVLDFGEYQDELFMAMELVEGHTLAAEIDAGVFPLMRIGPLFDQVLQILEAAHAASVVHRDIKPENVMIMTVGERSDHVKLLDFGLVHLAGETDQKLTKTGTIHGTPIYMSPEQCRGLDVGTPTDVYAVGVMLFEALSGRPPFEGDNAPGIMAQHMFVAPPPIADLGHKRAVSAGLEDIVMRALSKRPDDRPTASEFRDQLLAAFKGTDAISIAEKNVEEKLRVAQLTRLDRAVTGVYSPKKSGDVEPMVGVSAALWMNDDEGTKALRNTLGVNGITAFSWSKDELPPEDWKGDPVKLVVLSARQGKERILSLHAKRPRLGALVIESEDPKANAEWIRAGASDIALAGLSLDEIIKKIRRLIRRSK